jgi:hypothetical protein
VTDERFAGTFFSRCTHVVSNQSIGGLFEIFKTSVMLHHMKSITVNTLCSDRNSHFIKSGPLKAVMRQTFINLKRNKIALDVLFTISKSVYTGSGFGNTS